MRVVSFFSGAGGMDLGFLFAGHEIIWANDFDVNAVESYNHNIGKYSQHMALLEDITKLLDTDSQGIDNIIPQCDIIIGGFPCQGFSIANVNRNMEDERNFLYLQLLKAISVKQPPFFLLENVKGLENMEKGTVLNMILDDLELAGTPICRVFPSDGPGYTVVYNVLNALNFGVPQNRERVIILGIRNDINNHSVLEHILPPTDLFGDRKRLYIKSTHSPVSELEDELLPQEKVNFLYENWRNKTLNLNTPIFINNREILKTPNIRDAIGDLPYEFEENHPIFHNHTGSKCKVKINDRVGNRPTFWENYAPTIMGRGSGTGGPLIPPHPEQHRRFSVREVARLQTFPDDFIFKGSNSAAYRQIGNAVPVLMAYNIARIFPSEVNNINNIDNLNDTIVAR
ncbi:DNA cytosine methyltransferase [Ureibacillus thermosphaericus]|uniref:DNA cytosine methyltransferase n=1 Tax=Ureibacillus thermosphaericus TaxID=51173 RepID=UPI0002EC3603|nr:DNA cytosine methyltransferase [Ureibacillus thermosphaericus]